MILAVIAGGGGCMLFFSLLVRGWWSKMGEPVVRTMFLAWFRDPDQAAKRADEIKNVIENQIQRADGLIRKEIEAQFKCIQDEFKESLASMDDLVRKDLTELKEMISKQNEFSEAFRTNVMTRLGKIEGAINMITKGQFTTPSDFPAGQVFPRRPQK